jgi:YhcH/YjgK/YiaL family protein
MSQIYFTKIKDDTCFAEGHRDYIDIQYITKGIEVIEVYSKDEVELVQEYDPEKDYALYRPIKPGRKIILKPYEFAILYPENLHIPGLALDESIEVEKIVIKIPYNK